MLKDFKKNSSQNSGADKCPLCNSSARLSFQSTDFFLTSYNYYKYYQCNQCNLIFQNPIPEKQQVENFYPNSYAVHQFPKESTPSKMKTAVLQYKYNYKHLHVNWFFRFLAPVCSAFAYKDSISYFPDSKALDIGCGNGKFILSMNKLGWEMKGIDFNCNAVETCQKAGLNVYLGDLSSVSFEDNSFDLISVRHVIEHLQNPEEFILHFA